MGVRENWARDGYTEHAFPPRAPCSFLRPYYKWLLLRRPAVPNQKRRTKDGARVLLFGFKKVVKVGIKLKKFPKAA